MLGRSACKIQTGELLIFFGEKNSVRKKSALFLPRNGKEAGLASTYSGSRIYIADRE
jgi:hypothetical protein